MVVQRKWPTQNNYTKETHTKLSCFTAVFMNILNTCTRKQLHTELKESLATMNQSTMSYVLKTFKKYTFILKH